MLNIKDLYNHPEYYNDIIKNDIYRIFDDYMEKRNLTKKELSNQLNISEYLLNKILKGECNLSVEKLSECLFKIGYKINLSII